MNELLYSEGDVRFAVATAKSDTARRPCDGPAQSQIREDVVSAEILRIGEVMTLMKYCYSTDGGEQYTGQFDDAGAAAREAECEIDMDALLIGNAGAKVEYWVAEAVEAIDMLDCDGSRTGEHILEDLEERCADEVGGDDTILALSAEHQARLGRFVLAFVKRHNTKSVYGVRNAVKHSYVVGGNE